VRSAKRRHQSPEWMILSHVNCFIQGQVVGFDVLLDSLHPRSTGPPVGLLQFSKGKAVITEQYHIEGSSVLPHKAVGW